MAHTVMALQKYGLYTDLPEKPCPVQAYLLEEIFEGWKTRPAGRFPISFPLCFASFLLRLPDVLRDLPVLLVFVLEELQQPRHSGCFCPKHLCVDMCVDMRVGMCTGMRVETGEDRCVDTCVDISVDMLEAMGVEMRVGMGAGMHLDKFVDICVEIRVNILVATCPGMCPYMCRHVCGHVSRYVCRHVCRYVQATTWTCV